MTAADSPALEAPEIVGHRDLWAAAPPALVERMGIAHADHAGAHCAAVAGAPESRVVNHCLGLPTDRLVAPAALDAVERFFFRRRLPCRVAVADGAPAEAHLRERGYRPDSAWVKFVRDASPPAAVACDLAIREVDRADAARVGAMVAAAFGLPPALAPWMASLVGRPRWTFLGAYDGPLLVAAGAILPWRDSAWLTFAVTDPVHRGRGAQNALLAARIALAPALGVTRLVVETGEQGGGLPDPSYRNILGAGFRPAYRRPFWRLDPESA